MLNPFGRLLSVDLSRSTITEQQIDPDLTRDYVGGSGLAARLLWDRLAPDLDPLGPDNPLLYITGPLTGTAGPTNGRFSVCARSPATGLWGEANCGGFWGPELRFAGYDAVLITGRAASPVYLWIRDGMAELRGASHLWGQADTYQTQERIRQEVGDRLARVACVGVAGERLIPYSLILCDHGRVAGRAGMGAVMGSKNLKAIAVRGKGKLPIAQPQFFSTFRSMLNRALREENITLSLRAAGSASAAEYFQMLGEMPMRYFTAGQFEGQENVSGSVIADTILTGVTTCHACVIACGRLVTITEGPYTREKSKGPEYETMTGFGSILGSGDMNAATHLGQLCDVYGLDTISASNVIGLAYLLFDRGMLTERDTGGLKLEWGDPRPAEALLHLITQREGIGEVMSRGAKALGAHFGVEELAAHVNNLEMPYHDPRALSGMGIVYATSPRGACHNQSDFFVAEIGADHEEIGIPLLTPPTPDTGKAALVARHQDYRSLSNSLIVCIFARLPVTSQLILYNAAVGLDGDIGEFMQAGARIWNLKRVINHRFGLTRASDKLPKLLLKPLPDGPNAGNVPDFELLMREYYAARGWDPATGRPTRATLEALDLGFAADTLDEVSGVEVSSIRADTLDPQHSTSNLQPPISNLQPMILVTGATGFLGRNLIPLLVSRGHRVRALVRRSSAWQFLADLGVELAWGDTRDRNAVMDAMYGCRAVVHAAGLFRFWGRHDDFFATNVRGTGHVLDAARLARVDRFVHISTVAVVGRPKPETTIDEGYPCEPVDDYMRSKLEGEGLVRRYWQEHRLPAVILRPGAYYGPWGHYAFNRLFFEDPFIKGLPIRVHGGRRFTFPVYVPDLASAIETTLTHGRPGETYNVSGMSLTHREINATISRITGTQPRWIDVPAPAILLFARVWTALSRLTGREPYYPVNLAHYVFHDWMVDSRKARRELMFEPTPFEEGARATIEWYRSIGMLTHSGPRLQTSALTREEA